MALSPRARSITRRCLLLTAFLCTALAMVSIFLTLAAGTLQVDGEYATGGPGGLFMSAISVVRFEGIIPSLDDSSPSNYLVNLHFFLSAFGWEYPTASWSDSSGIVNSIDGLTPGKPLTLPSDLLVVARRLRLGEDEYKCPSCSNAFFASWSGERFPRTFSTDPVVYAYYLSFVTFLVLFVNEWLFRAWPDSVRCHCPRFMKSWCPCAKQDEDATSEAVRDRFRVWTSATAALLYGIAPLMLAVRGWSLVRYLDSVGVVPSMNARIGKGFIGISAATAGVSILAFLCVLMRRKMGEVRPWMENQDIDILSVEEPEEISTEEESVENEEDNLIPHLK
ncbi:hypothetical protein GQ53DRAFT_750545 [Thozetella sp. PMI_491]|nr:hypothetical protein GQ53DRAFT_750545 [Thozetella sp. PMI_491]